MGDDVVSEYGRWHTQRTDGDVTVRCEHDRAFVTRGSSKEKVVGDDARCHCETAPCQSTLGQKFLA